MRLVRPACVERVLCLCWPLVCSAANVALASESDTSARRRAEQKAEPSLADAGDRARLQPIGDRWAWEHRPFRHFFARLAAGYDLTLKTPQPERGRGAVRAARLYDDAGYAELFGGIAWGAPSGIQHGLSLGVSAALVAEPWLSVAPSYLFVWRPATAWMGYGRLGFPLSVEPNVNVGWDVAFGVVLLRTAALGVNLEALLRWPYGVTSLERTGSLTPLAAVQFGIWFDHEELP